MKYFHVIVFVIGLLVIKSQAHKGHEGHHHTCIHDQLSDEIGDLMDRERPIELMKHREDHQADVDVDGETQHNVDGIKVKKRKLAAAWSGLNIIIDDSYMTGTDPYACTTGKLQK